MLFLVLVAVLSSMSSGCLGCAANERLEGAAPARLRAGFPAQAARLLESERFFVEGSSAFALPDRPSTPTLRLPRQGEGSIEIQADALAISVREIGAYGEGSLAGSAVIYPRRGGSSIWTGTPGGFEEWLLLEPGVARGDKAAVAWEIEGALLRKAGDAVEIVDALGVPRIRVTAPVAYAQGGRAVPVWNQPFTQST